MFCRLKGSGYGENVYLLKIIYLFLPSHINNHVFADSAFDEILFDIRFIDFIVVVFSLEFSHKNHRLFIWTHTYSCFYSSVYVLYARVYRCEQIYYQSIWLRLRERAYIVLD